MDVEAEILDLTRRIEALEARTPANGDHSGISDTRNLSTTTATGLHHELADDLEALGVEISGLRWQIKGYVTEDHGRLMERLDDLRIGMEHLTRRLDQLGKKPGA